jgi:molybdopterin-guanine dinucleotide biosynthesis protein A
MKSDGDQLLKMNEKISGVILAGGTGKRLGGVTKSRLQVNGTTIVSRIISTIEEFFAEILIVTNTPEEFREHGNHRIISDEFQKIGPIGGIHAALKSASSEAIFVFAGDMPLLQKKIIRSQIDEYEKQKPQILIPRYGKLIEPLHSIYNISLLPALEKFILESRNNAVREFFNHINVMYFDVEDSERTRDAFMNINSPEDIILAEKILKNRRP